MAQVQLVTNPPWAFSGYGVECALLSRQLRGHGHDVLIQADTMPFGAVLTWEGFPVCPGYFPGAAKTDMTGWYAAQHDSDLVLVLLDAFALNASQDDLRGLSCPAAWWVPVDSMPLGAGTGAILQQSEMTPVAMSRFGQEVLRHAGFTDVLYVPHSVDTAMFAPLSARQRKLARDAIGADQETFIIGINAANQHPVRKGWFEQLYAFKAFHEQHEDSLLYAWTLKDGRPVGQALDALAAMLGISDAVVFRDPGDVTAGTVATADLPARFYAACDLVSNCSWAEGFGLAPLEAQSCGVPVVVTDFSAMHEVGASGEHGAWKVPSSPVAAPEHVAALWGRPQLGGIMEAYEQAWQEREAGTLELRGKAGREHALSYDHDTVYELYWQYTLDTLLSS